MAETSIEWTDARRLCATTLARICSRCRREKALEDFKVDRSRLHGRGYVCRPCERVSDPATPNRIERAAARQKGMSWCRLCRLWQSVELVRNGLCRPHQREEDRRRYATVQEYREKRKAHASRRKRGVDPVPPVGQESYLELFEGLCAYCDGQAETWDHVVPVAKGGKTTPENILPSCIACNSSKRDRDLDAWLEATGRTLSVRAIEHLSHFQVI